jgi:hypothetical protein
MGELSYAPASSRRTIAVPSTIARIFPIAIQYGVPPKPQSELIHSFSGATYFKAVRMRSATNSGVSIS